MRARSRGTRCKLGRDAKKRINPSRGLPEIPLDLADHVLLHGVGTVPEPVSEPEGDDGLCQAALAGVVGGGSATGVAGMAGAFDMVLAT